MPTRLTPAYTGLGGKGSEPQSLTDVAIPSGATCAIIKFGWWDTNLNDVSSVSLDGQAATQVGGEYDSDAHDHCSVWFVTGFTTGSGKTLIWTNPENISLGVCVEIEFRSNVDISSGVASAIRSSGSADARSAGATATTGTLTAQSGDEILSGYVCDAGTLPTFGPGQSSVVEQTQDGLISGFTSESPSGPGTQSITADFPAIVSVVLVPESASGSVGEGTLSAGASTVAGTGEREVTGTGALLVQSSAVSGSGALQLKLVLTQATNRNLVDESGVPVANLANIAYEWYDALDDTDGDPTQEGTFSTNENGEATIQLPNSALTSGQSGTLILYHPTDSEIRGVYRIPVT